MKNKMYLLAWICTMAISGAALAQDRPMAGDSRNFKKDYNTVWKAVVQTIVGDGGTITSQDKESGTISNEWFVLQESGMFKKGWRVKENYLVEKAGNNDTKVTIKHNFQNKIGKNEWRPASPDNDYTPRLNQSFFDQLSKRLGG